MGSQHKLMNGNGKTLLFDHTDTATTDITITSTDLSKISGLGTSSLTSTQIKAGIEKGSALSSLVSTPTQIDTAVIMASNLLAVNIKTFGGGKGDGTTNDTQSLELCRVEVLRRQAMGHNAYIYFPKGNYIIDGLSTYMHCMLIGENMFEVTLTNSGSVVTPRSLYSTGAIGIKFINFVISPFTFFGYSHVTNGIYAHELNIQRCKFVLDNMTTGTTPFTFFSNSPDDTRAGVGDIIFKDNILEIGTCYNGMYFLSYNSLICTGNTFIFTDTVSHYIRVNPNPYTYQTYYSMKRTDISNNKFTCLGTDTKLPYTGISFFTTRKGSVSNITIKGNIISDVKEEAITFDNLGNSESATGCICTGTISSATNDSSGRLVIGMNNMQWKSNVTHSIASYTVSDNDKWKEFKLFFNLNTQLDGTILDIYSFDVASNTITLDSKLNASEISNSGTYSVQGGFYNVDISYNTINGTPLTGIALWLCVCNSKIYKNVVDGASTGIYSVGGKVLGVYNAASWYNTIEDNRVRSTGGKSIKISSSYNDTVADNFQYGNKVILNTCNENIEVFKQLNSIVDNNITPLVNVIPTPE